MKNLKALFLAPLLAVLALPAVAHHGHGGDRLEKRIDRQEIRINRGVRNGELTKHEARKLRKRHRKIERMYDRFLDDGRLSFRERNKMHHVLDRNSNRIKRLKHNDRYRDRHVKHHKPHDGFKGHAHDQYSKHRHDYSPIDDYYWSFVISPSQRW